MENEKQPDPIDLMQWIGTTLEKICDVLMMQLSESNAEQAEFVDYLHNTKHVFMSELSEGELNQLFTQFRERGDEE